MELFMESKFVKNSLQKKNDMPLPTIHDYDLRILTVSQRYGIGIATTIILMLALIANAAAFVAHFKRKIRPIFRTCLISLNCSDILTSVFMSTHCIAQMLNEFTAVWILGDILCSFTPFLTTLAILVNSFTLVGIALDRYLAIVQYAKGTWNPGALFCGSWAVFVWGLAAGISSPVLASYEIVEFNIILTNSFNESEHLQRVSACICDKNTNKYYYSVVFAFIFSPLWIAFIWLYSFIAKEIWHRRRPIRCVFKCTQGPVNATKLITEYEDSTITKRNDDFDFTAQKQNVDFDAQQSCGDMSTASGCSVVTATVAVAPTETTTTTTKHTLNRPRFSDSRPMKKKTISTTATSAMVAIDGGTSTLSGDGEKSPKSNSEVRKLRMFAAILVLMTVFMVCRMPSWIFLLYKLYTPAKSNVAYMLNFCFGLLSLSNCVLNPLLYTFLTETIQLSSILVDHLKQHLRNYSQFNKTSQ